MDALNSGSGHALIDFRNFRNIRKGPKIFEREPLSEPLPIPKNVPKYSVFHFRESRYIFAKLFENPKLLPKRMALVTTLHHIKAMRSVKSYGSSAKTP